MLVLFSQIVYTEIPKYLAKLYANFSTIHYLLKHISQQFILILLVSIIYEVKHIIFGSADT
jgi:hypothetical protein